MATEQLFLTVDIERRGYGRRYSSLPVDTRDRDGFTIDCTNGYLQPAQYDVRVGDTVFWRDQGRLISATATAITRDEHRIYVQVSDAQPLPPETFHF